MNAENLLKIYNHLYENDIDEVVLKNPIFKGDIAVNFWYFPHNLYETEHQKGYRFEKEIKFLDQMFSKLGFDALNDRQKEDIRQKEVFYPAMSFDFRVKHPQGLLKSMRIAFLMFVDSDSKLRFIYTKKQFLDDYLQVFEYAEPFLDENPTEDEKYFFEAMITLSEAVCNHLKIETEQNKGVFAKEEVLKEESAFAELVSLLNHDNFLSEEEVRSIRQDWQLMKSNQPEFARKVAQRMGYPQEEWDDFSDFPQDFFIFELISYYFEPYNDDWKFDGKELGKYISKIIGEKFKISKDEPCDYFAISKNLEDKSDFALLNLDNGNDTCDIIVVRKSDKDRIIYLADLLNIPID